MASSLRSLRPEWVSGERERMERSKEVTYVYAYVYRYIHVRTNLRPLVFSFLFLLDARL